MNKKWRVLTNYAHSGHQYELWKLPVEVDVITEVGDSVADWRYEARPHPLNAKKAPAGEIKLEDYDIIIAHFDENALAPRHPDLPSSWGAAFRYLIDNYSKRVPTIAICHGAPQTSEQGIPELETEHLTIYQDRREKLVNYLKNIDVVVNSYEAEKEWGFKNSVTIWHGFDPEEFKNGERTKSILTTGEKALKMRPHCRGYYLYKKIIELCPKLEIDFPRVVDPSKYQPGTNDFAQVKFERYVSCLGKYRVFLNTTVHSPMPRFRGEAMMVGCATVNYDSHDINSIITNGINGFYSKDPEQLADILKFLDNNPDVAIKIGEESRKLAMRLFHIDRYLGEWQQLIKRII